MIELSFVVPCRNEEQGLELLVRPAEAVARQLGVSFEVVLVDDGSNDGTWNVVRRLAVEHPEVVGVRLSRPFGQQAALAAGLSAAMGERVLTLDADLQDPPEFVGELIAKMDQGFDVVHARRSSRPGETRFKRATAAAFYRLLNWLSDTHVERDCGEFRLYSRRAVQALLSLPEQRRFLRGLASWIGFKQAVVEYERAPRARGKSQYSLNRMLDLAADAMTAFSIRPLRLATVFALACAAAAGISGAFGTWALVVTHPLAPWAIAAAFIGGLATMQLLALGVIGEYLGRLYEQSLGRPMYIVEEVVGDGGVVGTARDALNGREQLRGGHCPPYESTASNSTAWDGHHPDYNGLRKTPRIEVPQGK